MSELNKTIIEIANIDRRPITKKNGEQSMIIAVTDSRTKRVGETWDQAWTANWKIGDTVEVSFGEAKLYTNPKSGITKETWPITNPNAAPKRAPGYYNNAPAANPAAVAWTIAATLLAPQFVGKKIDLKLVAELAEQVKTAMTPAVPVQPAAPAAVAAPVAAPAQVATPYVAPAPVAAPVAAPAVLDEDSFVEDSEKPF